MHRVRSHDAGTEPIRKRDPIPAGLRDIPCPPHGGVAEQTDRLAVRDRCELIRAKDGSGDARHDSGRRQLVVGRRRSPLEADRTSGGRDEALVDRQSRRDQVLPAGNGVEGQQLFSLAVTGTLAQGYERVADLDDRHRQSLVEQCRHTPGVAARKRCRPRPPRRPDAALDRFPRFDGGGGQVRESEMEEGRRAEHGLRVGHVVIGAEGALLRPPRQGVVATGRVRAVRRDGDGVDLAGPRRENGHLARLAGHQAQLVHRSAGEGRHVQMAAVDPETVIAVGGCRPAVPGARCHGLESFAGLLGRAQVAAGMLTARAPEFRRKVEVVVGR